MHSAKLDWWKKSLVTIETLNGEPLGMDKKGKTMNLSEINFGNKFDIVKVDLEGSLRLKPDDPHYKIDILSVKLDSKWIELNESNFSTVKSDILKSEKIKFKITASAPQKSPVRDKKDPVPFSSHSKENDPMLNRKKNRLRNFLSPSPKAPTNDRMAIPSPSLATMNSPGQTTPHTSGFQSSIKDISKMVYGSRSVSKKGSQLTITDEKSNMNSAVLSIAETPDKITSSAEIVVEAMTDSVINEKHVTVVVPVPSTSALSPSPLDKSCPLRGMEMQKRATNINLTPRRTQNVIQDQVVTPAVSTNYASPTSSSLKKQTPRRNISPILSPFFNFSPSKNLAIKSNLSPVINFDKIYSDQPTKYACGENKLFMDPVVVADLPYESVQDEENPPSPFENGTTHVKSVVITSALANASVVPLEPVAPTTATPVINSPKAVDRSDEWSENSAWGDVMSQGENSPNRGNEFSPTRGEADDEGEEDDDGHAQAVAVSEASPVATNRPFVSEVEEPLQETEDQSRATQTFQMEEVSLADDTDSCTTISMSTLGNDSTSGGIFQSHSVPPALPTPTRPVTDATRHRSRSAHANKESRSRPKPLELPPPPPPTSASKHRRQNSKAKVSSHKDDSDNSDEDSKPSARHHNHYAMPLERDYARDPLMAEGVNSWAAGLRNTGGKSKRDKGSKLKKDKGRRQSTHSDAMMKAMRKETESSGRPSLGTMYKQWEFLKSAFVGDSEEELKWLMIAKQPGAYKYAKNMHDKAEDRYYKSMFDIDVLDNKVKLLQGSTAQLPSVLKDIVNAASTIVAEDIASVSTGGTSDQDDKLEATRAALKDLIVLDLQDMFDPAFNRELNDIAGKMNSTIAVLKAQKMLDTGLKEEIRKQNAKLLCAKKTSEETLKEMEKWSGREKETQEYPKIMAEEEAAWVEKERGANEQALQYMRTFIPVNIQDLSAKELTSKTRDGLWPQELVNEIKNNKLLHWLVMHPADIAWETFLSGDKRQYFENLESLDLTELRALCICLPQKFELDGDGKKMEWRSRVIARTRQLVSQFNRELVKGGWNAECDKRAMVELPALKPDQIHRSVYQYRTFDQMKARIKQYDDKANLLEKKKILLEKADVARKDAKVEYDVILAEFRDADVLSTYGAENVAACKEQAKKDLKEAEARWKGLSADVARLSKAVADCPMTKEQMLASMEETTLFVADAYDNADWRTSSVGILVKGLFDPAPEINRKERLAAKFVTAEEEAAQRKLEIASLNQSKQPLVGYKAEPVVVSVVEPHPEGVQLNKSSTLLSRTTMFVTTAQPEQAVEERPKSSILSRLDPKHLSALTSMIGGGGGGGASGSTGVRSTPMRIAKTASCSLLPTPIELPTAIEMAPKPVKKTNSKLLKKRMTEGISPPRHALFGRPGAGLSFLDQIKARTGDGDAAPPNDSTGGAPSFLDQIKMRKAAGAGAPPMSFLDQIKAKRCAIEEDASVPDTPAPTTDSGDGSQSVAVTGQMKAKKIIAMEGAPPMSFLEQIKARRPPVDS